VETDGPVEFRNEPRFATGPKKEYRGEDIVVIWEPAFCIHVANCLAGLPDVFDASRRPWVEPDLASADEVAKVVMTCPTGALHFRRLDDGAEEPEPPETTVQVRPNGPVYLHGKIRIEDADGNLIREDTRVALCRCGGSANKPFCDGTHRTNGFKTQPEP
jgi:uncharacterized Fe-S cluster protein YjdI/CDGSH-type Zn-finger protein